MPKRYFGLNPAYLTIYSEKNEILEFWAQSTECYKCPLTFVKEIHRHKNTSLLMNTVYPTIFEVRNAQCNKTHHFIEKNNYNLDITDNGHCTLNFVEENDIYLPILWCALAYLLLGIVWFSAKFTYKQISSNDDDAQILIASDLGSVEDEIPPAHHVTGSVESTTTSLNPVNRNRSRLKSLDTFRGFSLILMIFVNYGGGQYYFFNHSVWNGLTVADLVFPWFIWIMGVSMVLSFHSLLRRAVPKWLILLKILKRSAILFFLGLILNGRKGYTFESFRILGVLQRFSLCYLIVGCCDLLFTRPNDAHRPWWSRIRDIVFSWPQWICAIILIIIHTCLTFFLHDADCTKGYLGPGGLNNDESYNCTGGAAGIIDRAVLGLQHMYQTPTCRYIYDTKVPYDPEGILGILTSSFLVFLGLHAGKILVFFDNHRSRIVRWLIWGVITGVIGTILCKASKDEGWIPINKNLWSLSFVLILASMSFFLLSFLYWIIDCARIWSGGPFLYAGMNSIFLYVGHEFTHGVFPWNWACPPSHLCYLASAAWGSTLWVIISIYLYYKKFFLII
uniref:Uncharacterized protein n=1 Tax=Strigamia maritima TaxID=126957 RepID=T1ITK5_STRMM